MDLTYENIKDKIIYALYDDDCPGAKPRKCFGHQDKDTGLIKGYHILLKCDDKDCATIPITPEMCDDYNYNVKTIMEDAERNMQMLLPKNIVNIGPMFMLTNEKCFFGASGIFYDDILSELEEKIGGDYYVIPSSKHEVMITETGSFTPCEIYEMLEGGNRDYCDETELLSYKVFMYDAGRGKLCVVYDNGEVQNTLVDESEEQ